MAAATAENSDGKKVNYYHTRVPHFNIYGTSLWVIGPPNPEFIKQQ
jgi:hypothetical protein